MKIRPVLFIILLLIISVSKCFSQGREADNWYFGLAHAVNFITGNPVTVNNSAMFADYGSTSLSDTLGNILFYSDGKKIYDRNNQMMPNGDGLMSTGWATSPCVAFQKPDEAKKYYLFTVAGTPTTGIPRVYYSVIDMNLHLGYGDIIHNQKNIALADADSAYQTIGAVRHGSKDAYWVIVREHGIPNKFLSFLVDAAGVNQTPVVSPALLYYSAIGSDQSEIMKISPDGKYLLYAARNQLTVNYGKVELYYFDNNTGKLSPALLFNTGVKNNGAEFSANSEFLYMSHSDFLISGLNHCWVSQYDLKKINDVTLFENSAYKMIEDTLEWYYGNLLLANNRKIYFTQPNLNGGYANSFLGVINNPYLYGPGCDLQVNSVLFYDPFSEGLPTIVSSYMAEFDWTGNCAGEIVKFRSNFYPQPTSLLWDFGDPSSGAANNSNLNNPGHTYLSAGLYTVSVTVVYQSGNSETATRQVNITTGPAIDIGDTIYICKGDSVVLSPGSGYSGYLWNTGSQNESITVQDTGIYWVEVSNPGDCSSIDSVRIFYYPEIRFDDDSVIIIPTTCGGATGAIVGLKVFAQPPYSIQWTVTGNPISNSINIFHLGAGLYELRVTDGNGCTNIVTSYAISDAGNILIDTASVTPAYCGNNDGTLSVTAISGLGSMLHYFIKTGNDTLSQWSNGEFTNLAGGKYYAWVSDSSGCISVYPSPLIIAEFTAPSIVFVSTTPETGTNADGTITVDAVGNGLTYTLNGAAPVNSGYFTGLFAGLYSVTVTNPYGCDTTFTINVEQLVGYKLSAIAGNGSACLGKVAKAPVNVSNFRHISAFETILYYEKSFVTCNGYICELPQLSDSLDVMLFPSTGTIKATWKGDLPLTLPDNSELVQFVFGSLQPGSSSLQWDISPGISHFSDSTGADLQVIYTMGRVLINDPPVISGAPMSICEGDTLILSPTVDKGTGTISYNWDTPNGPIAGTRTIVKANATLLDSGPYTLRVIDTVNCADTAIINVKVVPPPAAGFENDTIYFENERQLIATPGYSNYIWNTGDTSNTILVNTEGWYIVNMLTPEGCSASDSAMMLWAFVPLSIPNAFSPNGNGLNDHFRAITYPEKITSFSLFVYNQWGSIVYQSTDIKSGWDGSYLGEPSPAGMYAYTLTYGNKVGNSRTLRGTVLLVR